MFNFSEYKKLSDWLLENYDSSINEEAVFRVIISRYYYYVFHEVRLFLLKYREIDTSKFGGGEHKRIMDELQRTRSDKNLSKENQILGYNLGVKLGGLKLYRVKADYFSNEIINKDVLNEFFEKITKFLEGIQKLTKNYKK